MLFLSKICQYRLIWHSLFSSLLFFLDFDGYTYYLLVSFLFFCENKFIFGQFSYTYSVEQILRVGRPL